MTPSEPLLNTDEILFNTFQLGIEAEEFLKSSVGGYLMERAKADLAAAVDVFINVSALTKTEAVAEAQLKARSAISTIQWLADAIDEAGRAETQLRELDDLDK